MYQDIQYTLTHVQTVCTRPSFLGGAGDEANVSGERTDDYCTCTLYYMYVISFNHDLTIFLF